MPSVQNSVTSESQQAQAVPLLQEALMIPEPLPPTEEVRESLSQKLPKRRRNRRDQPKQKKLTDKKKNITSCPHTSMAFYAKGMCKNCYHQRGREKLADKCPHIDRANYAHGVCKNCYLSAYHRERRMQNKKSKNILLQSSPYDGTVASTAMPTAAEAQNNVQPGLNIDLVDVQINGQ